MSIFADPSDGRQTSSLVHRYACRNCGGDPIPKKCKHGQPTLHAHGEWACAGPIAERCRRCLDVPDFGLGFTVDPDRIEWECGISDPFCSPRLVEDEPLHENCGPRLLIEPIDKEADGS